MQLNAMEVICLEDRAFYALVENVVNRIQKQNNKPQTEKWINGEEAMSMLKISSRTTLQKFRDEGKIRYSQLEKKVILYDRDSIIELVNKNIKDTL